MAFGGGNFTTMNKVLPGTYINFISARSAGVGLSDRGVVLLPMELDWGEENKIFAVTAADILQAASCRKLLGHVYADDEMLPVREVFRHATKVYFFRLNSGGAAASNTFATAKYTGTRGNALKIVIEANENGTDDKPLYDVSTYMDTTCVDTQKGVAAISELTDNGFVVWKSGAVIALTANTPLSGGTNGSVSNEAWQTCLDKAEAYSFHALACTSTNETICGLYAEYTKRMRNEVGKKFQCVLFRQLKDFEGVVSLKNTIEGETDSAALIPWAAGVIAGTAVNASAANMAYDGEYTVDTDYTQSQLETAITEGSWIMHNVDGEARVLSDINTFVSYTDTMGEDFSSNQTIRVLDQIATDIAALFGSKYNGKVPNDAAGRVSLWNDIVSHHKQLQSMRAIENFASSDVTVTAGDEKDTAVVTDYVQPVNAFQKLYMVVHVE